MDCGWRQAWSRLRKNVRFLLSKLWWGRFAKVKSKRPAAVYIPKQGGRLELHLSGMRGAPPKAYESDELLTKSRLLAVSYGLLSPQEVGEIREKQGRGVLGKLGLW